MTTHEVYRNTSQQLTCLPLERDGDHFVVLQGIEGKKLKATRWSLRDTPSLEDLRRRVLSTSHLFLYTAAIDRCGRRVHTVDSAVFFWKALGVQTDDLRKTLIELFSEASDCGVPVRLSNDAIGLTMSANHWIFGLTTRPTPQCICVRDGQGSGEIALQEQPELLAIIGATSLLHPNIHFSDADGNHLSPSQVLDSGSRFYTDPLTAFLERRRISPLAVTIRKSSRLQVPF